MDVLKLLLIISIFSFCSCAKVQYLFEQGGGQFSILTSAESNEEVLQDQDVSLENKEKIKKIEQYKDFFYQYFNKEQTDIYSETSFLDNDAVSYLVIASKFNEIKAKDECFPIMGCFPYLGFFKKESAITHAKKLEQESWITWIRPVYAYSSLGYFTDPILSSFFVYSDYELAEMIFHELFHTIFFIKDDVELNENLANYFGRRMAMEYFKLSDTQKADVQNRRSKDEHLRLKMVSLIEELSNKYKQEKIESVDHAKQVFDQFFQSRFLPEMEKGCSSLSIEKKDCRYLNHKWNNASFAAYMTYEKESFEISQLHKKLGISLREFFTYIEDKHKVYQELSSKDSFTTYLLSFRGPN